MTPAKLKQCRETLKLTQVTLAERLGVHPLTVSRWERGAIPVPNPVSRLLELWLKEAQGTKAKRRS